MGKEVFGIRFLRVAAKKERQATYPAQAKETKTGDGKLLLIVEIRIVIFAEI
jgi:hypothetical protein